jgi:hypothetical protein
MEAVVDEVLQNQRNRLTVGKTTVFGFFGQCHLDSWLHGGNGDTLVCPLILDQYPEFQHLAATVVVAMVDDKNLKLDYRSNCRK